MSRRATTDEPSLFGAVVEPSPAAPAPPATARPALFVASPKIQTRAHGRFSVAGREFDSIGEAQAWVESGCPHPVTGARS